MLSDSACAALCLQWTVLWLHRPLEAVQSQHRLQWTVCSYIVHWRHKAAHA